MSNRRWRVLGLGCGLFLLGLSGAWAGETENTAAPVAAPDVAATPAKAPVALGAKPELYVPPLTANGVPAGVAQSLSELLTLELEQTRLYTVKSQSEIRALLQRAEVKQMLGDESDAELLAATRQISGGDLLVSGSIGRVGKTYVLTLALIDLKNARVTRRVKQTLSGDSAGLIGSLHAAVVALALEEKGFAPDITAALVDGLLIGQKDKTFFLKFMLGYETAVGARVDRDTIAYILPNLLALNINAAWQALPYMQLQFETGIASSLAADYTMQNKNSRAVTEDAVAKKILQTTRVQTTHFDYQTERVPLNVMLRFAPTSGRLLPHFSAGLGVSWQRYHLGSNTQEDLFSYRAFNGATIPTGDPAYTNSTKTTERYVQSDSYRKLKLAPQEANVDLYNLQMPASVGLDYLLTQHFGLGFEVRYTLTYALNKSEDDLQRVFARIDEKSGEIVYDMSSIRRLHHGIGVFAGVFYYY